ncbi:polysialyltransferase family glycosyltransferase [Roseivirga sp. 4D4]|uniref:polysialyltransferase family glycosyltransferase n=1 Tax=Roseivirga sp. 4D4 TaxID=1889784 RepID=UPI001112F953|nr:polysialyltransferase family glycosyltransferase [Roseivirga sp. 4D4]
MNSAYDINYWSERIAHDRIKVLGPLGYSAWWQRIVAMETQDLVDAERKFTGKFDQVIAFILRGPNGQYLSEEDYQRLMAEAITEFANMSNTFIYVKPHPRQDISEVEKYLDSLPKNRFKVVDYNTFVLGRMTDFSVSFWSSAITDFLAIGTPTIEYFSFNGSCSLWLRTRDNAQTSFFDKLGLTLQARDKNSLRAALKKMNDNIDEVRTEQLNNFSEVFENSEEVGEKMIQYLQQGTGSKKRSRVPMATLLKSYLHVFFASLKGTAGR